MAVKRAETTEDTDGVSSSLSNGVIAAICVVCGLALFGTLAFLVICLSRKKHRARQLAAQRHLDLADDDSIHNALDSTITPVQHPLEKTDSANPFLNGADPKLQDWYSKTNGKVGTKGENGEIIPPAYAFHMTGTRDSWPLISLSTSAKLGVLPDPPVATLRPIQPSSRFENVGMAQTTNTPPHSAAAHTTNTTPNSMAVSNTGVQRENPTGHGLGAKPSVSIKHPQMFTFGPHPAAMAEQKQPYPYPPPLVIRPSPQHFGPPSGARHARGKSANGLPRYRTETDSQLITVLKSTSQRLREAQAQAAAQAMSMNQAQTPDQKRPRSSGGFGAVGDGRPSKRTSIISPLNAGPPKEKAKTPPQKNMQASMLFQDYSSSPQRETESVCESSNTSVLDMFYTSDKIEVTPQKQKVEDAGEKSLFDTENRMSVHGVSTGTPMNSSPDNTNEHSVKRSPGGTPVTARKLHHDSVTMHQLSSITLQAKAAAGHQRNMSSIGDPYVIRGSPAALHVPNVAPSNIGAIRPLRLTRTESLINDNNMPLRPRSGNKQSDGPQYPPTPTKRTSTSSPVGPVPNPPVQLDFQWPMAQLPVMPPPAARQNKGHKRSKTVRLSHQLIRSSIAIVPEEKEENTPPKSGLTVDTELARYNSRASHQSYSATMELFDIYSSPSAGTSPSKSPSRTPERYKRRSVSVNSLTTSKSDLEKMQLENMPPPFTDRARRLRSQSTNATVTFKFPDVKAEERKALSELKMHARSDSVKHTSPSNTVARLSTSLVKGPRDAAPPVDRNSVQASIGLLRRMDSLMSTSSLMSQSSGGDSPRMPSFVDMGTSPTRQDTMKRGQNNYLGLGKHRAVVTAPVQGVSKRVSELAAKIESRDPSPERQRSVRVQPESVAPVTPTKRNNRIKKGLETDGFGSPVGSNALGIVPVLEPPLRRGEWKVEKGLKAVKSSPTLGRGAGMQRRLSEKDSGVDMRSGGKGGEEREGGKETERADRDSCYDEKGFLKSSPTRR